METGEPVTGFERELIEILRTPGTERLFFYGPGSAEDVTNCEEAKRWFNYGALVMDERGGLAVRIRNTLEATVFALELPPPS